MHQVLSKIKQEFPDKSKKPNKESKADFPKGKVKKPLRKKAMSQPELSEFEQFKQTAKDDVEREQRENQALREQIAAMHAAQVSACFWNSLILTHCTSQV